jgi:hypothetical protein
MKAVTERAGIDSVMSCSACFSPYQNENPSAAIAPYWTRAGCDCGVAATALIRTVP